MNVDPNMPAPVRCLLDAYFQEYNTHLSCTQVGSRAIGVATESSDDDWLILVPRQHDADCHILATRHGFRIGGSEPGPDSKDFFESYKLGNVNLLMVYTPHTFSNWVKSVEMCRLLVHWGVPVDKAMRVQTHLIIMEDMSMEEATKCTG